MNFLAHDLVLPIDSSSLVRIGAAMPDLWALVPHRPLPRVVLLKLAENATHEARDLAVGIASHLRADASFHRHSLFHRKVDDMSSALARVCPAMRHPTMAAHVLAEMLLDVWIIQQDPAILTRYYAAFETERCAVSARLAAHPPEAEPEILAVLERFRSSEFLRDYQSIDGLVDRFLRTLGHVRFVAPFPLPTDGLVELVGKSEWTGGDEPAQLLHDIRGEVALAMG